MVIEIDNNVMKMYGVIYEYDGPYIESRIKGLAKANPDGIRLVYNGPGGNVFGGNLIRNAIESVKSHVTFDIVGLCASMGPVIMTAADKVRIANNAFIMVHAPSGSVWGNAKAMEQSAKVLRSIEKNFISIFKAKTGKTEEELKEWLIDDNWFDAEEALSEGIVDEVIDAQEDIYNLDAIANAANLKNIAACAGAFEPYNKPAEGNTFPTGAFSAQVQEEKPPQKPKDKSKSNTEMKLNAKSITALGLDENPSDEAVNAKIEAIAQRNADLEAEAAARNAQAIEDLLDKHKLKYDAKMRPTYKAMAENNMETAKAVLESLPTPQGLPNPQEENKPSAGIPAERKDWTAKDWKQKDMKGLIALKKENPEAYQALFK